MSYYRSWVVKIQIIFFICKIQRRKLGRWRNLRGDSASFIDDGREPVAPSCVLGESVTGSKARRPLDGFTATTSGASSLYYELLWLKSNVFFFLYFQYFPTGPMPMGIPNPAMRKPETSDDRHVLAKHSEIYPSVSNF